MAGQYFPKREQLIRRLIQKSIQDELEWEEGTAKDSVLVAFKTSSVTIEKDYAWNDQATFSFVVRDGDGQIVDRFEASDLRDVKISDVWALYEKAWRQVKDADETIDDILKELD